MLLLVADLSRFVDTLQGDGREEALQKALLAEPSLQNNPGTQPVLDFLYEFGKKFYLMNVGGTKGEGVERVIKERKPKVGSWTRA